MKLFDMLKDEHREVLDMFEDAEEKQDRAFFDELSKKLSVHMRGEEQTFYPLLKENADTQEAGYKSVEQHRIAETLMEDMQTTPDDMEWWAKFQVLKEIVEHHIEDEESEVFPSAEMLLETQDDALTGQFNEIKGREEAGA